MAEGKVFFSFDRVSSFLHQPQKCIKAMRLFRKSGVYVVADPFAFCRFGGFRILVKPTCIALSMRTRVLNYRKSMLDTDQIAELPHRFSASSEIPELAITIQVRRVPIDMIVNMSFIHMGADDEGMIPLREALGKLIADSVRLFRRDLARLEGLPDLIRNHVAGLIPPCLLGVFTF